MYNNSGHSWQVWEINKTNCQAGKIKEKTIKDQLLSYKFYFLDKSQQELNILVTFKLNSGQHPPALGTGINSSGFVTVLWTQI